jgi:hypothetical protein
MNEQTLLTPRRTDPARRTIITALMAVTTAAMVIGNPVLCLWIASALQDSKGATSQAIVVIGAGLVIGTTVLALILHGLANRYNDAVGTTATVRRSSESPWSGAERVDPGHQLLGTLIVLAMIVGAAGLGVWFFLFADGGGSSFTG